MDQYQPIKVVSDSLYSGFRVGLSGVLTMEEFRPVLNVAAGQQGVDNNCPSEHVSVLGGRTPVTMVEIPGKADAVIKQFFRGGLLGFFVKDRYLKLWGPSRACMEFVMLKRAAQMGVNVPEPLGFAEQGRFCYRCWLVTRQIPGATTLAALSVADENRAARLMPQVMEQVDLMARHGMFHADLHPGNLIIDPNNKVWVIDFDKAGVKNSTSDILFMRYQARWNRAVGKHGLPEQLSHLFIRPGV